MNLKYQISNVVSLQREINELLFNFPYINCSVCKNKRNVHLDGEMSLIIIENEYAKTENKVSLFCEKICLFCYILLKEVAVKRNKYLISLIEDKINETIKDSMFYDKIPNSKQYFYWKEKIGILEDVLLSIIDNEILDRLVYDGLQEEKTTRLTFKEEKDIYNKLITQWGYPELQIGEKEMEEMFD